MSKNTRAVGYCRTSTEAQRDNTSIANQKATIERFAAAQGWRLVRHYTDEARSGSKIEGREQFQQMMRDAAGGGQFDVVVVYDLTRFGRDGMDVLESARTLAREYGVHVVDTKGQFDTRDRSRTLSNFVTAGMTEDERLRILERTKKGKIEWARRTHAPVTTKRPFGRVWKRTGRKGSEGVWVLDLEKKAMVEDCARRYLAGEQLPKLAKEYGVNHSNLCKVLRERCGPVWVQHVRCRELGIDETIETPVPSLLDDKTIRAVRDRLKANRTYLHKPPKSVHGYLLSGRIFCGHCGYGLFGQTNPNRKRYYRHTHTSRKRECPLHPRPWVRADEIEEAVVRDLFCMLGNPAAIERAVKAAVPDYDDAKARRDRLQADLTKLEKARGRVVDAIADGVLSAGQAKSKLDELAGKEGALRVEVGKLDVTVHGFTWLWG
jgi:DNA invertase Pin-like site-specific DNA recombinase